MAGYRLFLSAALLALLGLAAGDDIVSRPPNAAEAAVCVGANFDTVAGWHKPHPTNCNEFVKCDVNSGISTVYTCKSPLLFNNALSVCDWPENVVCSGASVTTTTTRRPSSTTTTRPPPSSTTTTRRPSSTTTTTTTTTAGDDIVSRPGGSLGAAVCAGATFNTVADWHRPHPDNCNEFVKCDVNSGITTIYTCKSPLLFNNALSICDWPQNVVCGGAPVTTTTTKRPSTTTTTTRRPSSTTTAKPPPSSTTTKRPTTVAPASGCGDYASLCLPYNPHRYHKAHPSDPAKFCQCDWTVRIAYEMPCAPGTTFDARLQVCT